MKFINTFFVLAFFGFTMQSCRTSKKITGAISKQDSTITKIVMNNNTNQDSIKLVNETFDKILNNTLTFNTFSAKVKIDYNADGQNIPDLIGNIRLKKDSLIWINVDKNIIVNINVARILIRKDSFFVMNKLEKEYMARPLSYIQEISQLPFDFKTIENLLMGNPVYFNKPITNFKKNESTTTILCAGDLFKHLVTVNNNNFLISHSKLDDVDASRNRTCDLSYEEYELKDGKQFSKKRSIVISEKNKIEINLDFKQYHYNELQTYPFSIPSNYKKI